MDKVLNVTTPKQKFQEQLTPRLQQESANSVLRDDEDIDKNPAVLPPDHPLLERFQQALKAHLLKVNAELTEEIAEIDHNVLRLNREREEIGSALYDYQQEIEHQKDTLDDYNNQLKELCDKRLRHEANAKELKKNHDLMNGSYKDAKRAHNERLMELNHIQTLENNVSKWTKEIEDEVEAAKRIVSKDSQNQSSISQEKKQMDLILFNLDSEVRRSERELEHINEQISEQNECVEMLNGNLADANSDLNALQSEQKRLRCSWNEVIVAIQQRDRTLMNMRDSLDNEQKTQKVIQSNIDGTKRNIAKEMEQNEKLEAYQNRIMNDISSLKNQYDKHANDHSKIMNKIQKMNSVLEHTESDLSKATVEGHILENQLKSLRKLIEKQSNEKVLVEEQILDLLQDQITTDQASHYRAKMLRETQERRRTLELTMYSTEQQLSRVLLDLEKWKGKVHQNKENAERLMKKQDDFNQKLDAINQEIHGVKTQINVKVKSSDLLSKKLAKLVDEAGGQELDPNEIRLKDLEKNMTEIELETRESQNFWIRLQGHVVNLSEKRSQQLNNINLARKQLMVIEQKTLKVDYQLEELCRQDKETSRELKKLNLQLDQLSGKIFERKKYYEKDEAECEHSHDVLVDKLKKSEMSVLSLEQELRDRQKEIEEMKNCVLEKHREALSWETKWKMAAETKRFQQQENSAASEIGAMKAEIHRMEVRYAQLRRAQEKLVHDMENCVMHREHIYDEAAIREKMPDSKTKSRFTIQHRLNEMKNKLKHVSSESVAVDRNIGDLFIQKAELIAEEKKLNQTIDDERLQDSLLQNEIEQAVLLKQGNLENIVRIQQRAKRYRALINAKQLPKCRSEAILTTDMDRHQEINNHLLGVLESLLTEFPDHKFQIRRVLQSLQGDE